MQGKTLHDHGGTIGKAAIGAIVACLLATAGIICVLVK